MSKLILGTSSICILYQVYVNYCAIRIPWLIGFSYAEHQKTAESKTIKIEGRDEGAHINFYSPEQDAHSRWSILKNISDHFEYSAFKALANFIGRNWPMQASLIG